MLASMGRYYACSASSDIQKMYRTQRLFSGHRTDIRLSSSIDNSSAFEDGYILTRIYYTAINAKEQKARRVAAGQFAQTMVNRPVPFCRTPGEPRPCSPGVGLFGPLLQSEYEQGSSSGHRNHLLSVKNE